MEAIRNKCAAMGLYGDTILTSIQALGRMRADEILRHMSKSTPEEMDKFLPVGKSQWERANLKRAQ